MSYRSGTGARLTTAREARGVVRWRFDLGENPDPYSPLDADELRQIRDLVVEGEPRGNNRREMINEILRAVDGTPEGRTGFVRADLDALLEWSADGIEGTSWDG